MSWEPRAWVCSCGSTVTTHSPGKDTWCERCGQDYNAFGQRVTGPLESIDPLDAGEEW